VISLFKVLISNSTHYPRYVEGWSEYEDAAGQPFFTNAEKAASQWEHPLQRYYHGGGLSAS
jgi:hypothetical protein